MRKLLLTIAILQGCGTAPTREGAATVYAANLKGDMGSQRAIQLCEVDGKVVGSALRGYPDEIQVAPGEHTIKFRYYDSDAEGASSKIRELPLKVRAGGRYIVTFEPREVLPTAIWIEDRSTREIVGGSGPARTIVAVPPGVETDILRADWKAISPETAVKLYTKAGLILSGRVIGDDGEYLWLRLSEGGKKATLRSEIDKIAAVK